MDLLLDLAAKPMPRKLPKPPGNTPWVPDLNGNINCFYKKEYNVLRRWTRACYSLRTGIFTPDDDWRLSSTTWVNIPTPCPGAIPFDHNVL